MKDCCRETRKRVGEEVVEIVRYHRERQRLWEAEKAEKPEDGHGPPPTAVQRLNRLLADLKMKFDLLGQGIK